VFIPFYSPEKNAHIESFNSDWDAAFWQRERFRDLTHVQEVCLIFERWYRTRYEPPALKGLTPAEARDNYMPRCLPADFDLHQAEERLSLTVGRLHFVRLVNNKGQIKIVNEWWAIETEENLVGEYVWATISTREQRLRIYHQSAVNATRQMVTEYEYEIAEEVQELARVYQADRVTDALA